MTRNVVEQTKTESMVLEPLTTRRKTRMTKALELTHATQKNDKKEVTHYDIVANGVTVGKATKAEKGMFAFEGIPGAVSGKVDNQKTMRDLKVAVGKLVITDYVTKNAPAPKPKIEKTNKAAEPAPSPAGEGEDINLD